MNKELLILIYALCCYNFISVPMNVLTAIVRMLEYFPFGHLGCFCLFSFGALINNSTSLTLALISYERRSIVTSRMTESPGRVTTYNYCLLIRHIRKHRSNNSAFEKRYKKHVFFSRLMIICLVEFVLSQIPFDFVLFFARIQDGRRFRTLQTSAYYLGYTIASIDNIINPLWFSFASFKKRREKGELLAALTFRPSSRFSHST